MERFGKYIILDQLKEGGMAKICRARLLSEDAGKIVAIKLIRPVFSADEGFKKMFIDEIKVTFGLGHSNIAQIFDYGKINNQLYTAMEYIDGMNLQQLQKKLQEQNYLLPLEISLFIMAQVSQGLHYAHNYCDKLTGKNLNIIHRDISPHNIMVSYDGEVKIVDFGIAKATTNSELTKTGMIKGKVSYLAPEYLKGLPLDHHYDQFATGIILWELLCGHRLFDGESDMAIFNKIQGCRIPVPSSINPKVSKELDEIVLKSLHKNPQERFHNMEAMNRALLKFLYVHYPEFNSSDLSVLNRSLFAKEIVKDRQKLLEFGQIDLRKYIEEFAKETQSPLPENVKALGDTLNSTDHKKLNSRGGVIFDFGFRDQKNGKLENNSNPLRRAFKNKIDLGAGDPGSEGSASSWQGGSGGSESTHAPGKKRQELTAEDIRQQYLIIRQDKFYGPFNVDDLLRLVLKKKINLSTYIFDISNNNWERLGEVAAFHSFLPLQPLYSWEGKHYLTFNYAKHSWSGPQEFKMVVELLKQGKLSIYDFVIPLQRDHAQQVQSVQIKDLPDFVDLIAKRPSKIPEISEEMLDKIAENLQVDFLEIFKEDHVILKDYMGEGKDGPDSLQSPLSLQGENEVQNKVQNSIKLNNERMWYVQEQEEEGAGNVPWGPFRHLEILRMLQKNIIQRQMFVKKMGDREWRKISTIEMFSTKILQSLIHSSKWKKIFNLRGSNRANYMAPSKIRCGKNIASGTCTSISEGGCFIELRPQGMQEGEVVEVSIMAGVIPLKIEARATIVAIYNQSNKKGLGLEFHTLNGEMIKQIRVYVDQQYLKNHKKAA